MEVRTEAKKVWAYFVQRLIPCLAPRWHSNIYRFRGEVNDVHGGDQGSCQAAVNSFPVQHAAAEVTEPRALLRENE